MEFSVFNKMIQDRFDYMQSNYRLFRSNVTGDELWLLYLNSFRDGDDPIFRDPESSSHNCNNDRNFIRRYGNIVGIDERSEIVTMFDLELDYDNIYYASSSNMSRVLIKRGICNIFFETFNELNLLPYQKITKGMELFQLGTSTTYKQYSKEEVDKYGIVKEGIVYEFNHFHVYLNRCFVKFGNESIESIMAVYRDSKEVFKRGLDEISLDTLELVRDLINQGSLLNGDSYLDKVIKFINLKKIYNTLDNKLKDNWCWFSSYEFPFARFRNELIGTLCIELTEGVELNKACETWNKRVDPVNYMKAKAPITQSQIKEAQNFVEENGYGESFDRRFANIDDININEILHSNVGKSEIKSASIFDNVQPSKSTRHKRSQFDGIEEVVLINL